MMTPSRLRILAVSALAVALLTGALSVGSAAPIFARKYGFTCTMCHSNYPRLNDFGVRYRQNGYQLPGREDDERTVLESPTPLALRTTFGFNYDTFKHTSDAEDVRQFQIAGLDLLSGGLLARDIGYFLIYPPQISGSRGVVGQDGTVEMASLQFTNLFGSPWLSARAGRFEPAYVAFSVKRQLSYSPYEVYEKAFPGGSAFAETMEGIEFTGHGLGWTYAAGYLNGSSSNTAADTPQDCYARVTRTFGQGEGQTAGQRVGLVGYLGRSRPDEVEVRQTEGGGRESFERWGVDASLNLDQFNLALQCLQGNDSGALWGTSGDVRWTGGFAELSWLPTTDLVGFARYDRVSVPGVAGEGVSRWTAGARRYLADNIAIHLEYSHRNQDTAETSGPDETEDFLALRLDAAL